MIEAREVDPWPGGDPWTFKATAVHVASKVGKSHTAIAKCRRDHLYRYGFECAIRRRMQRELAAACDSRPKPKNEWQSWEEKWFSWSERDRRDYIRRWVWQRWPAAGWVESPLDGRTYRAPHAYIEHLCERLIGEGRLPWPHGMRPGQT